VWDNNNHGKALRPTNNKATQIHRPQPPHKQRQWAGRNNIVGQRVL